MGSDEVGLDEVLEYGIRLTAVILILAVITGGLVFLGTAVAGDALLSGGSTGKTMLSVTLFVFAGVVFFGGMLGIVYKVIADGVKEGVNMSDMRM